MRFKITWRDGAYYVNRPEYDGGEVVDAQDYDRAVNALRELWESVSAIELRVRGDEAVVKNDLAASRRIAEAMHAAVPLIAPANAWEGVPSSVLAELADDAGFDPADCC